MKEDNKISICKSEIKNRLVKELKGTLNCNKETIYLVVDEVFNVLMDELVRGNSVTINKFGKFDTSTTERHIGRHPMDSTEFIMIDEKIKPTFKTGKDLRDKIKEGGKGNE